MKQVSTKYEASMGTVSGKYALSMTHVSGKPSLCHPQEGLRQPSGMDQAVMAVSHEPSTIAVVRVAMVRVFMNH